jgi:hypothetical protein
MSSIYRKGRDGYYYYQTYVYNSETKKNDKRIYHSLKTKKLQKAQDLKQELDNKYSHKKRKYIGSSFFSKKIKLKNTLLLMVSTIFLTLISQSVILKSTYKSKKIETLKLVNNKIVNPIKDEDNPANILPEEDMEKVLVVKEEKEISYKIERIENLSGPFKQGRIHIVVDDGHSKESQKITCKKITKEFLQFSNIIICIYSDTVIGKELANNNWENVSLYDRKQNWLAMYSFNSTEGEYFDDNPTRYLGNH